MNTEATAKGNPAPTTPPVQINVAPGGLEALKQYERELATYRRELPRLLNEGNAWRYIVIAGDAILGIWEKQGEAIQAARAQFGPDAPIFVRTIDPRDPQRFAMLDDWLATRCQA